jgi:cytochrome c
MNMKHLLSSIVLCCTGAVMAATPDDKDMMELLKASGCMSCHATAEKLVGPSFQAIAAKYAGQPDAADGLIQSVRNGSRGKWGRIPMPAHNSLNEPDLKALANWVLKQKP